jgi:hydroxyethylthiazole kinase-like uncharacterized protein yjeF
MEENLNFFLPDASAPDSVLTNLGNFKSDYKLVTYGDVSKIFQPRKAFSHKGTFGHVLVVAGNENTMGAAILCSMACLHAGAGLTTASIPESGLGSLNTALPEVMYLPRSILKDAPADKYKVIAIGPGLATDQDSIALLKTAIKLDVSLVIDADAINILAKDPSLLSTIPKGSIITPHLKEFDHLFGDHDNWYDRLLTARKEAKARQIIIVLKNQYTFIIDGSDQVFINTTGNPGMAQGGMGDVLTGLISAYIAQGYSKIDSVIFGCYLHGRSGDELCKTNFNVTASQVAVNIPRIVRSIFRS